MLEDKYQDIASFQVNQEKLLSTLEQEIIELNSSSSDKEQRLDHVESTVDWIDKNVKIYIDRRVKEINMSIDSVKSGYNSETVMGQIKENVKEILKNSIPTTDLRHLRQELESIKHKNKRDEIVIENIRSVVTEVKDQLDRTLESPLNFSLRTKNPPRVSLEKKEKEWDLTKNAINSSAKLLNQLIETKITESSDLAIIKKCNSDVKKLRVIPKAAMIF